jgi:eukaryotic-like serine/threonine-protein kinase
MPERRRVLSGRYELIRQIGEGGFSRAYLADDLRLGRKVVAKILRIELSHEAANRKRFEREARIAASVSGPNIVEVYDYGTDNGQPVIISQWIDGVDLSRVIRKGSGLRPDDAISIMIDVLGGLETLHNAGVQHRDIKPSNVLIPKWNAPAKLTDFGISRGDDDPRLTLTGQVLGSPAYMSPEQVEGMRLTSATDIYSASIVFYELVTGSVPFTGESASKVMLQHLTSAPPPPRMLRPDVEPAVEKLILKGLAKPPDERFASAKEMALELRQTLLDLSGGEPVDQSAYRTRVVPQAEQTAESPASAAFAPSVDQETRSAQSPPFRGRKRGYERPRKKTPFRRVQSEASPSKRRSWFRIRRRRIPRYPFILAAILFLAIMLLAIIQTVSASIQSGEWIF